MQSVGIWPAACLTSKLIPCAKADVSWKLKLECCQANAVPLSTDSILCPLFATAGLACKSSLCAANVLNWLKRFQNRLEREGIPKKDSRAGKGGNPRAWAILSCYVVMLVIDGYCWLTLHTGAAYADGQGAPSYLNCAAAFYMGHVFVVGLTVLCPICPNMSQCPSNFPTLCVLVTLYDHHDVASNARSKREMIGFLSIVRYPMRFTFIDCILYCDASNFRVSTKQLSQNTGGGRSPDLEHCVASAAALHLEKRTWRQLPPLTSARLAPTDEMLKQDGKNDKTITEITIDYIASSPGPRGPHLRLWEAFWYGCSARVLLLASRIAIFPSALFCWVSTGVTSPQGSFCV